MLTLKSIHYAGVLMCVCVNQSTSVLVAQVIKILPSVLIAFSALTPLVGRQEQNPVYKN